MLDQVLALQGHLEAVKEQLESQQERAADLEATLSSMAGHITLKQASKMPDEALRKVFAYLSNEVQDAVHERLFPKGE